MASQSVVHVELSRDDIHLLEVLLNAQMLHLDLSCTPPRVVRMLGMQRRGKQSPVPISATAVNQGLMDQGIDTAHEWRGYLSFNDVHLIEVLLHDVKYVLEQLGATGGDTTSSNIERINRTLSKFIHVSNVSPVVGNH